MSNSNAVEKLFATFRISSRLQFLVKLLTIFQQGDVYLNEPNKINELIKSVKQSIQRRTRDRNGKDNNNKQR